MSRYTKVFAALIIGGSSIAMIAAAPPVDSNGDGVVTRAEFNGAAGAQFDAADANADGFWTTEEMVGFQQDRRAKRGANKAARRSARDRMDLSSLSPERRADVEARLDRADAARASAKDARALRKAENKTRKETRRAESEVRRAQRRTNRSLGQNGGQGRGEGNGFGNGEGNGARGLDGRDATDAGQQLSRAETRDRVNSALQARGLGGSVDFDSIDKDGDGQISSEERAAMIESFRQTRGNQTRGNQTRGSQSRGLQTQGRQIDPGLTETQRRQLGDLDKNGDGRISQDERDALREEFRTTGRARLGSSSFGGRGVNSLALGRMDTNADGKISRPEFMALSDERFGNFDTNNDGQLSGDENTGRGQRGRDGTSTRLESLPADGRLPNGDTIPNARDLTRGLNLPEGVEGVPTREQLEQRIREQLQQGLPNRP